MLAAVGNNPGMFELVAGFLAVKLLLIASIVMFLRRKYPNLWRKSRGAN